MSESIRWGFLGASNIARTKFIPAVQDASNATAYAVASRSADRARELANAAGVANSYGSYDEMLADDDVDAVYVSVPNTAHAEWIVRALEAGKPVLSEKPMVIDGLEAQRVLEASTRAGLPVLEGFMYRFHPQNVHARAVVAAGEIGEVREVRVHFSYPLVEMLDADNIRVTDGPGAGAIMDIGSYVVSAARDAFGTEPVDAIGYLDTDERFGIDAGFSGSLRFPGDRFATVSWSLRGGYGAGYTIVGSRGSLVVPHAFMPGSSGMRDEAEVILHRPDASRNVTPFEKSDHFVAMVEAFSNAVIHGEQLPFDAADALGNARALDLIRAGAHPR